MTFGDKLSKLRRAQNYTQEQLADLLNVSRQSVSKWESDIAYPETDKLVKICELFGCSSDYLLLDVPEPPEKEKKQENGDAPQDIKISGISLVIKERKSSKTIGGMPLWHVAKNARGFIAIGVSARGIIAVGVKSCGVVSVGVLSLGIISIGTLSLGLLFSVGMFSAALFGVGAIAAGIFSVGSISFGMFSLGAVAIGDLSVGALAVGRYAALGDRAYAAIAIGKSVASGEIFEYIGELSSDMKDYVKVLIDQNVPSYLHWAAEIVKSLL